MALTERERMERTALAARRGFQRAQTEPAYVASVRRCLEQRAANGPHAADGPWIALHGLGGDGPESVVLRTWLDSDETLDTLWERYRSLQSNLSLSSILSQSPHAGAYATWSTPPMSSAS